jgi:hypothetical protein
MKVEKSNDGTLKWIELPDAYRDEPQCSVEQRSSMPEEIQVLTSEGAWGHLSRETVRALIPHLQAFVDTGSIEIGGK